MTGYNKARSHTKLGDKQMDYTITEGATFPLVNLTLAQNETVQIESGSMVYHDGRVSLEGSMNSNGKKGFGGLMSAIGRSVTSGESFFITRAIGQANGAQLAIAPKTPGAIKAIQLDSAHQWRLNTGAFLAGSDGTTYSMTRQKIGGAIFGGTGGLFVMETAGAGEMLINAYGDIQLLHVTPGAPLVVDNDHVIAWSSTLDYEIKPASGLVGFTTGEGLVNAFTGTGDVYIQTRNLRGLAELLKPMMPSGGSSN
jgi:uncharacterized protein (TIGR00266 family)